MRAKSCLKVFYKFQTEYVFPCHGESFFEPMQDRKNVEVFIASVMTRDPAMFSQLVCFLSF